jgi:hypothetical protein
MSQAAPERPKGTLTKVGTGLSEPLAEKDGGKETVGLGLWLLEELVEGVREMGRVQLGVGAPVGEAVAVAVCVIGREALRVRLNDCDIEPEGLCEKDWLGVPVSVLLGLAWLERVSVRVPVGLRETVLRVKETLRLQDWEDRAVAEAVGVLVALWDRVKARERLWLAVTLRVCVEQDTEALPREWDREGVSVKVGFAVGTAVMLGVQASENDGRACKVCIQ